MDDAGVDDVGIQQKASVKSKPVVSAADGESSDKWQLSEENLPVIKNDQKSLSKIFGHADCLSELFLDKSQDFMGLRFQRSDFLRECSDLLL